MDKYRYLSPKMFSHTRHCSSCGFCRIKCPTLDFTGNESWGARGRMLIAQEVARGTLDVSESIKNRCYSCTLCKACELACPSLVKVSDAMMELRENFYKESIGPLDVDQELINRFKQDGTPFGPQKSPSEIFAAWANCAEPRKLASPSCVGFDYKSLYH